MVVGKFLSVVAVSTTNADTLPFQQMVLDVSAQMSDGIRVDRTVSLHQLLITAYNHS